MYRFLSLLRRDNDSLTSSQLYNEHTFYASFIADIQKATGSIIIESPFISQRGMDRLFPALTCAINHGVSVTINTRCPDQHEDFMRYQALNGITALQTLGVKVLYTTNLHRKLAIVDQQLLWEGSLNILSFRDSSELMRRTQSETSCRQMMQFTEMVQWYT